MIDLFIAALETVPCGTTSFHQELLGLPSGATIRYVLDVPRSGILVLHVLSAMTLRSLPIPRNSGSVFGLQPSARPGTGAGRRAASQGRCEAASSNRRRGRLPGAPRLARSGAPGPSSILVLSVWPVTPFQAPKMVESIWNGYLPAEWQPRADCRISHSPRCLPSAVVPVASRQADTTGRLP